jgi:septation ring formation regulator EzrA
MSHETVRLQKLEEQMKSLAYEFANIKETHNYNVKRYTWISEKCDRIQKEFDELKKGDSNLETV